MVVGISRSGERRRSCTLDVKEEPLQKGSHFYFFLFSPPHFSSHLYFKWPPPFPLPCSKSPLRNGGPEEPGDAKRKERERKIWKEKKDEGSKSTIPISPRRDFQLLKNNGPPAGGRPPYRTPCLEGGRGRREAPKFSVGNKKRRGVEKGRLPGSPLLLLPGAQRRIMLL